MLPLFLAMFVFGDVVTPLLTAFAWRRWATSKRRKSRKTRLSFAALVVATFSLLIGVATIAYSAHIGGGYLYLPPRLARLYQVGIASATGALVLALLGAFRPNPIRWRTPLISLGAFVFWFLAGSGE
jgi:hypothetical protein